MIGVFKPAGNGEHFATDDGSVINVRDHFYFACERDGRLQIRPSGPSHSEILRGVRLTEDAAVQDITANPEKGIIRPGFALFCPGSLLLRSVRADAGGAFRWYGLTPEFEKALSDRIQRVACVSPPDDLRVTMGASLAADWGAEWAETSLGAWKNRDQAEAHLEDVRLKERLGLTKPINANMLFGGLVRKNKRHDPGIG